MHTEFRKDNRKFCLAELGSRLDESAGKQISSLRAVADWRGAGGGHRSGSGGRGADGGAARRPERERSPGKHDVIGRRAHYDGPPKYESILFFLF